MKQPRIRDEDHLDWIRSLPCIVTGRWDGTEAAHVRYGDPRFAKPSTGMAEKPHDHWVVPLHWETHRHQHSENERSWWKSHGIDPLAVAAALFVNSGDDEAGRTIIEAYRNREAVYSRRIGFWEGK